MDFCVDESSKLPIYRQIADWLETQITTGVLPAGHRLQTEREFCAALGVARGTIKNAYIELEKRGRIEKIQGKGTFVLGGSKEKERAAAAAAIRRTIEHLRALGLSAGEIDDVIRREAWNRLSGTERLRVAWVDRIPELFAPAARQIAQTCNVAVATLLADGVAELADASFDLLATSAPCYEALCNAVEGRSVQIERVAFSVNGRTVGALSRIGEGERIAVLYKSEPFLAVLRESLAELGLAQRADFYSTLLPLAELCEACKTCRTVFVPPAYTEAKMAQLRARLPEQTQLLPFEYVLDNGSLMHLRERAQFCWEQRVLWHENGPDVMVKKRGNTVNR